MEKEKQTLELGLTVSKEQFTSKDGLLIEYFVYTLNLLDQNFRLQVKPEDKRMLNYLLNDLFDGKGTKKNEKDII